MTAKRLTIGLLAHVDAGKTTLSEALLYTAGSLRKPGRVDHGDAFLDTDVQERERGITIFSKQAELTWRGTEITLMDTPGHADFSSETERTLGVLDGAVLLISGADGVQGHTMTLWRLLQAYRVPVILFVNKMDQAGTDRAALMRELKNRLSDSCVDMEGRDAADETALCDEHAMEVFLGTGIVPEEESRRLCGERKLFPCLFGSALRLKGIGALLDAAVSDFPGKEYPADFAARVFKITRDPQGARLTWMKILGGSLKVKTLLNEGETQEKVNQIRLYSGPRYRLTEEAEAGQVCAVTGLTATRAGDGLGVLTGAEAPLLTPVFSYQVLFPAGDDPAAAMQKLRQLEEEDPQLHVVWTPEKREIHVHLMGEVQPEILKRQLADRFGLHAVFSEGSILYRETIRNTVEGVGHYEPLRHYAEVHLLLEPGEPGSGLRLGTACSEDQLDRNWQRLILTHLMEKQHRGVLTGAPVTDMKITLIAGRAHLKHTEGGDFRQATYRAVRQGLMQADSVLLEPWYDLLLEVPGDAVGRAMSDLTRMGGRFDPPETDGEKALLRGSAPVAAMRGYAREVTAYTRGGGRLQCVLKGYAPCRDQESVCAEIGYDPERDVENTPDSVFCAHGAGFTVRWNRVPDFMHLHPETGEKKAPGDTRGSVTAGSGGYRGTAEEDRELERIFEKTYGPVKSRAEERTPHLPRVNGQAMGEDGRRSRKEELILPEDQTEYLLVDGYNIIFAWPDLKETAQRSLDDARYALTEILSNYHGFHPCELILVFDAYRVRRNPGSQEEYAGIHIVYTKEAETADNYIEKTIRQIARKKESRIRVATSDGLEQVIILGGGALRVSAEELRKEVEAAKIEIGRILESSRQGKEKSPALARAYQEALERKADGTGI